MKFFEEQTRQSSNTIDVKRECSDARGTHEWRPDARGKKRKTCLEGSSCKVHRVHYMEEGIKSLHAHFLEVRFFFAIHTTSILCMFGYLIYIGNGL